MAAIFCHDSRYPERLGRCPIMGRRIPVMVSKRCRILLRYQISHGRCLCYRNKPSEGDVRFKGAINSMDIQRPSNAGGKKIRRIAYGTGAVILIAGVTLGLARLRPAGPTVEAATIWPDTVKRGPMLREVRGLGTLIPEDIRWIPAQTDSRVDRIVLRPGAIVKADSIILELSNLELQRDALDAEYQLKGAEADYENLKVQLNSDLLNQRAATAAVRSDYEQAKLQHEVDDH